jgi:molybdopterin converting factor small subunit
MNLNSGFVRAKIRQRITVAILLAITATTSGCRSTDEYKKLAQAGVAYADALDTLLDFTVETQIRESSEALLAFDRDIPQTRKFYGEVAQQEVKILDSISRLKEHNHLIVRYFGLLQDLAGSDAPDRASAEVGKVAANLNKLGAELRSDPLLNDRQSRFAQGVTKLVISSRIRGALRNELDERGSMLMLELNTQAELLDVLGNELKDMLTKIKGFREQKLVIEPYAMPGVIASEETWIQVRKDIIKLEVTSKELKSASIALADFSGVFQDFIEGKPSQGRVNNLLADIENLLSVIEELKKESGNE